MRQEYKLDVTPECSHVSSGMNEEIQSLLHGIPQTLSNVCEKHLTRSFAVTFPNIKSNVSKTSLVIIPSPAKVHAPVQAVLYEQPA